MPIIALGRDQSISVNGQALVGTREIDVQVAMQEQDVTSWAHGWKSVLPVCSEVTVSLTIYGHEDAQLVLGLFNQHPPVPALLGVSGLGTGQFVPTSFKAGIPVDNIVAYDVTFKGYQYE